MPDLINSLNDFSPQEAPNAGFSSYYRYYTTADTTYQGQVCYADGSSVMHLARADNAINCSGMLGISMGGAAGTQVSFLVLGYFNNQYGFSTGQPVYLSDTVWGGLMQNAPTNPNSVTRSVGYTPSYGILSFNLGGLGVMPGPTGADGTDGVDGAAATIAVGTTTTLPAGSSASVSNSGSSSAAVFNFAIPKGDKGDRGSDGNNGTNGVGVPTGGTANQVLAKIDSTNYNTQWVNPPSGATWGSITGTLSDQTDLQAALNAKQDSLSGTGFVKQSGSTTSYDNSTYTPTTRTLSINGTAYDLSANRSWTIPLTPLTPWTQDIDGAGHSLSDVGKAFFGSGAGNTYYNEGTGATVTINGRGKQSWINIATGSAGSNSSAGIGYDDGKFKFGNNDWVGFTTSIQGAGTREFKMSANYGWSNYLLLSEDTATFQFANTNFNGNVHTTGTDNTFQGYNTFGDSYHHDYNWANEFVQSGTNGIAGWAAKFISSTTDGVIMGAINADNTNGFFLQSGPVYVSGINNQDVALVQGSTTPGFLYIMDGTGGLSNNFIPKVGAIQVGNTGTLGNDGTANAFIDNSGNGYFSGTIQIGLTSLSETQLVALLALI